MKPEARILNRIPDAELERRWARVRAYMAQAGLDALVMQANSDWLGGSVKWFTDIPATNGYPRTVIFPREGEMTVVEMGPFGTDRRLSQPDGLNRGVGRILGTPSFFSIAYTQFYDADLTVEALGAVRRVRPRSTGRAAARLRHSPAIAARPRRRLRRCDGGDRRYQGGEERRGNLRDPQDLPIAGRGFRGDMRRDPPRHARHRRHRFRAGSSAETRQRAGHLPRRLGSSRGALAIHAALGAGPGTLSRRSSFAARSKSTEPADFMRRSRERSCSAALRAR